VVGVRAGALGKSSSGRNSGTLSLTEGRAVTELDLRLLRCLVAVADAGSFTRAAEVLELSQPALSQRVQRLEALVGATLLERHTGRGVVRLTPAGESLRQDAVQLLAHADGALTRARRAAASGGRRTLHVGFTTSTPRELTVAAVRVAAGIVGVDLVLDHVPWGSEPQWLASGGGDALFLPSVSPQEAPPGLRVVRLGEQQRVAVFPADHPLADRETVTVAELAREPIVDAATDRDYWLALPRRGAVAPVVVGPPARTVEEMLAMVAAGLGMAITSAAVAANNGHRQLAFVPVADLEPSYLGLATLVGDRRGHLDEFVEGMARLAAAPA
jgi:DNA-binding transcriptional LysR family regulator